MTSTLTPQKKLSAISFEPSANQLLWTSGWDSTFRLLQLVLEQRVPVQPIYLIDPDRRSLPIEIRTMRAIKQALTLTHPHTADLILPTFYNSIADLLPDPEIDAAAATIRQSHRLGDQYPWLARFCKQHNLTGVEMGIISGDSLTTANNIRPYLDPTAPLPTLQRIPTDQSFSTLIQNETQNSTTHLIDSQEVFPQQLNSSTAQQLAIYQLFQYFSFPIINLTKQNMYDISLANTWLEFMELTWFCLKPLPGDLPCGQCNPCKIAKNEGMAWRFPPEPEPEPEAVPPPKTNTVLRKPQAVEPKPLHMKVYNRLRRTFKVFIGLD